MTQRVALQYAIPRDWTPRTAEAIEDNLRRIFALLQGPSATVGNANGPETSLVDQIVLFADTGGKVLKGATGTGLVHSTLGVASFGVASYLDIQDISATKRILGRKTAGSGVIEECTLSEVLDFITSAAQGDVLFRGAAAWARLPAGTGGFFLRTNGAAADPSWAPGSTGTVTGPGVSVDGEAVLFNGITGDVIKRATGTGVAHLVSGVMSASSVIYADIQNVTNSHVLGRRTAGSGVVEECTTTQILDFIGSTQGQILYRTAGTWQPLAPGTAGQFLQTAGAAADPGWADAGNVTGQASSVDSEIALFSGTTGKIIKRATGTGVVHVTSGVFGTSQVTYAELQDVSATSRVLARKTAGPGSVEEATLSEILDFIGSAGQGDLLFRGAAGWQRLAAGTAGYFLKAQGAGADVMWDAAGSGTGDVTGPSSSVDSEAAIFNGTSGKIIKRMTGTGVAHLVSGVLSASSVVYADMQNISADSRILGRKAGGGAGVVQECTLSETLDMVGSAAWGDILFRGTSLWQRLAAGTSGQFLKTFGAGADPAWATGLLNLTGSGNPQGVVSAAIGALYFDTVTGYVYKKTGGGSTAYGWYPWPDPSNIRGPIPFMFMPSVATASQAFGGASGYGPFDGTGGVAAFTQSGTASKTTINGKVFGVGTTAGAATVANFVSLTTNNQGLLGDDIDIWAYIGTDATAVTVTRIWFGWTTSSPTDAIMNPTDTGTRNWILMRYASDGNAVWEGLCASTAGTTARSVTSSLGSVVANTQYLLRIRFVRQGTPTVYFSVDDGTEQSVTGTNIPAVGAAAFLTLAVDLISGATNKAIMWRGIGGAVGS